MPLINPLMPVPQLKGDSLKIKIRKTKKNERKEYLNKQERNTVHQSQQRVQSSRKLHK